MALYLESIPAEDEDSKLKGAVGTQGDKDWVALSALVRVERENSVGLDGRNALALIVAPFLQSRISKANV
jgi:hypothetical protein